MNILYIAYSCSPNHGSEDRIGWMIPLYSSRENKVAVITKAEHKAVIDEYLKVNGDIGIDFHYVDIPLIYKKLYKGAAYSGRLKTWQKRALSLARELCRDGDFDIIHQITPVEFRSIGDYGSIEGVRFVCGPVGGGEYIPRGLRSYAAAHTLSELVRRCLNRISLSSLKRRGVLKRCDALLYANNETRDYISHISPITEVLSEVGVSASDIVPAPQNKSADKCSFLVAGRLNFRKGHALLLDALSELPRELDYECNIVGAGPELKRVRKRCERLGLSDKVILHGRVPFDEMAGIYARSGALVVPSLRETTGSVIPEAMSKGLPVITISRFGGGLLVDDSCGWTYNGLRRSDYIKNLSEVIKRCIEHSEDVALKASGAANSVRKETWQLKAERYNEIYRRLL